MYGSHPVLFDESTSQRLSCCKLLETQKDLPLTPHLHSQEVRPTRVIDLTVQHQPVSSGCYRLGPASLPAYVCNSLHWLATRHDNEVRFTHNRHGSVLPSLWLQADLVTLHLIEVSFMGRAYGYGLNLSRIHRPQMDQQTGMKHRRKPNPFLSNCQL